MKKIGIYSGTFDPVHNGHIEFALAAKKQLGLDEVLLLPEESPREKQHITSLSHRIHMLKLATQSLQGLTVITLQDKQFTVQDTLPKLKSLRPHAVFAYMCGSDVVNTFRYRWEGLEQLLIETEIIVGLRKTDTTQSVHEIFASLPYKAIFTIIESPNKHLASTSIRGDQQNIEDLDPQVADYIVKNKLYS